MSSSRHSALASLTATYTDSEDEGEASGGINNHSSSAVKIIEKPKDSPPKDSDLTANSSNGVEKGPEPKKKQSLKSLGLVSYLDPDDLIDDDAVDDIYTSDSNMEVEQEVTEEELKPKEETASAQVQNGELTNGHAEVNGVSKKRSRIPPEPPGKCPAELQDKFTKMYEKKLKGRLDMNSAIQRNKNFRNPSIYEKLIKFCDVDELGSNYDKAVFDPHEWHVSSYYDELAKTQKEMMERREKERKERTKVEFVTGTIKKPAPLPQETEPKRKSKWDQRGVMPPLLGLASFSQPSQPGAIPPFTTTVSGTKSTVISAFGTINNKNKKP